MRHLCLFWAAGGTPALRSGFRRRFRARSSAWRKMMSVRIPVFVLVLLSVLIWPLAAMAQDDDPSLGDIARNLRKSRAAQQQQPQPQPEPARTVIDNDNLP